MSTTYQERASYTELQECLARKECKAEYCFFPWTVKDFLAEAGKSSDSFGALMFSPSGNGKFFTLWKIDLKPYGSLNDIYIDLRRLKSQNSSPVLVRFHWELLDVERNKTFPGSIHAIVNPNDKISNIFVTKSCLLENRDRILARGDLHILCEMRVYERTVEDIISDRVNANVPYGLCMLSEDMKSLFRREPSADLHITALDSEMRGHRSILSARSNVFAELLKKMETKNCRLNLSSLQSDVLHSILMHIYCGNIDLYFEHTIPKDLYSEAKKYGLLHLQQHLDSVLSNSLTRLKSIDVTWKIPLFNTLILQPKTLLFCPDPNRTFFDNRWCFKLEFERSRDEVDISIIRKQDECSAHIVKFTVQVETYGSISAERSTFFVFDTDEVKRMEAFIKKDELCNLLSFKDTLVLKCSLEVVHYINFTTYNAEELLNMNSLSAVVESFTNHVDSSLQQLSKDLYSLFDKEEALSDVSVKTKNGEFRFHSFIAEARFLTPENHLKAFLENLDPMLVVPFFLFLYGGEVTTKRAIKLRMAAQNCNLQNIMLTFSDFLSHLDDCEDGSAAATDSPKKRSESRKYLKDPKF